MGGGEAAASTPLPGTTSLAEQPRATARSDDGAAGAFERATRGAGSDVPFRPEMERAFGADFSPVQAFLGRPAAMRELGAHAAAQGERVVFAGTAPDRELVAHELAHVMQQRQSGPAGVARSSASQPGDAAEQEAGAVARRVAGGELVSVHASPSASTQLVTDEDIPSELMETWRSESFRALLRKRYRSDITSKEKESPSRHDAELPVDESAFSGWLLKLPKEEAIEMLRHHAASSQKTKKASDPVVAKLEDPACGVCKFPDLPLLSQVLQEYAEPLSYICNFDFKEFAVNDRFLVQLGEQLAVAPGTDRNAIVLAIMECTKEGRDRGAMKSYMGEIEAQYRPAPDWLQEIKSKNPKLTPRETKQRDQEKGQGRRNKLHEMRAAVNDMLEKKAPAYQIQAYITGVVDELLRDMLKDAIVDQQDEPGAPEQFALVAFGSFARKQMSTHSDLDLGAIIGGTRLDQILGEGWIITVAKRLVELAQASGLSVDPQVSPGANYKGNPDLVGGPRDLAQRATMRDDTGNKRSGVGKQQAMTLQEVRPITSPGLHLP